MKTIWGLTYRGRQADAEGKRTPAILCATEAHAQEVADFHNENIPLADRNFVEYDIVQMDIEEALDLLYKHSSPGQTIHETISAQEEVVTRAANASAEVREMKPHEYGYLLSVLALESAKLNNLYARRSVIAANQRLQSTKALYEEQHGT